MTIGVPLLNLITFAISIFAITLTGVQTWLWKRALKGRDAIIAGYTDRMLAQNTTLLELRANYENALGQANNQVLWLNAYVGSLEKQVAELGSPLPEKPPIARMN
jgi:hypothetical protein